MVRQTLSRSLAQRAFFTLPSVLHNNQTEYWRPIVSPPSRFTSPKMQGFPQYFTQPHTQNCDNSEKAVAALPQEECNGLQWRISSCANEVDACFKASKLWEHVQVMHLSTNMRVHLRTGTLARKSADVLLKNG